MQTRISRHLLRRLAIQNPHSLLRFLLFPPSFRCRTKLLLRIPKTIRCNCFQVFAYFVRAWLLVNIVDEVTPNGSETKMSKAEETKRNETKKVTFFSEASSRTKLHTIRAPNFKFSWPFSKNVIEPSNYDSAQILDNEHANENRRRRAREGKRKETNGNKLS